MIATIGAEEAQVVELCTRAAEGEPLSLANFNAPGQIVISGAASACDRAERVAGEMGIRIARLAVAGAFHSALMRPAAETLRAALARVEVREPGCVVMSNTTGLPHGEGLGPGENVADSIRRRLVEQLTEPVRWAQNCQWVIAHRGSAPYHELAPGKVLSGLMRRIDKNTKVQSHAEPGP
jgi:[acyl-carrier-protein] S-malonyltransferase